MKLRQSIFTLLLITNFSMLANAQDLIVKQSNKDHETTLEKLRPSWKIPSELRSRVKTKLYFLFLFGFRMILKSILVR
ncbi:hypothetical protein, partial [Aquiflexum lacus]|uniref:hypothetical protein n=1 Tax=Aquiflexum lacus TaxID=2483805 RepID=UPI001E40C54D